METTESVEKIEVEENTCTCGAENDPWPPVRVENAGTGEFGHELVDVTFQAMAGAINVARGISEASWGSWRFDDLGGYLRHALTEMNNRQLAILGERDELWDMLRDRGKEAAEAAGESSRSIL